MKKLFFVFAAVGLMLMSVFWVDFQQGIQRADDSGLPLPCADFGGCPPPPVDPGGGFPLPDCLGTGSCVDHTDSVL